jgi:ABC-type polysaccharide/polyol phosphate transport system ATPase subunit
MKVVEVTHLSKSFRIPTVRRSTVREQVLSMFRPIAYEELKVLEDVSLSLQRGESLGIMGRNGCGKSTLLKIIAGIYLPDRGSVQVQAPVTPILELGVGWNPELNAIDNVCLLGAVMGMTIGEIRRTTQEILEFADLSRFAQLKLKHYSSGMAARLAYSVAFMAVREVLILDEIFAVGDAEFKQRCRQRYQQIHASGRSILLVSHNPWDITEFCDRALLLEGGRIILDGAPDEVAAAYDRMLVQGGAGAAREAS